MVPDALWLEGKTFDYTDSEIEFIFVELYKFKKVYSTSVKGARQCAPTGISDDFLSIDWGVPFLFDPDDFRASDVFVLVVPQLRHLASVPVRIGEFPASGSVVLQSN